MERGTGGTEREERREKRERESKTQDLPCTLLATDASLSRPSSHETLALWVL